MFGERGGELVGIAKGGVTKNGFTKKGFTKTGQAIFGNGRLACLSALSMALRRCVSPILESAPWQSTWTAHRVNKLVSRVSRFGRSSFSSLSSLWASITFLTAGFGVGDTVAGLLEES